MATSQVLYLNFQKPPPRSVKPGEVVRFSARISNDLKDLDYWPSNDDGEVRLRWFWVALIDGEKGSFKGKERERLHRPTLKRIGAQEANSKWQGPSSAYALVDIATPTRRELGGVRDMRLAGMICPSESKDTPAPTTDPRKKKRAKADVAEGSRGEEDGLVFSLGTLGYSGTAVASTSEQEVILPVLSDLIQIKDGGGRDEVHEGVAASKLNHTSRLLRLSKGQELRDVIIHIVEQSGFDLDKHIWDAALFALELLCAQITAETPANAASAPLFQTLHRALTPCGTSSSLNIVELGSGTSLVLVGLLALLEGKRQGLERGGEAQTASRPPQISAVATDLNAALPIIELNLLANSFSPASSSLGISTYALALDWESDALPSGLFGEASSKGAAPDLILVSDCTYNPCYFRPLCRTIARLLRLGVDGGGDEREEQKGDGQHICFLTKKHRHEEEERLWEELKDAGLIAKLISGVQGWEGQKGGVEGTLGAWVIQLA